MENFWFNILMKIGQSAETYVYNYIHIHSRVHEYELVIWNKIREMGSHPFAIPWTIFIRMPHVRGLTLLEHS